MKIVKTIYPPLTLLPEQRQIFDAWPQDFREKFQDRAGYLEFVSGMTTERAEADAFEFVALLYAERVANASR